MKKLLLILFVFYLAWFVLIKERTVSYGPGVLAPDEPLQERTYDQPFQLQQFTITPLADFEIKAKVLSREDYSRGRESRLSPTDLALGWGRMSDESVLEDISISQSGRWYRWRTQSFPIPRREIEKSSANMHIIPGDENVRQQLSQVRQGDIVHIRGALVRVDSPDGWHWVSSLSRDDTGGGACELILADFLLIDTP